MPQDIRFLVKPTTQDVVLRAVRLRLIESLPAVCNEANVLVTADADEPTLPGAHALFFTISPLSGEFQEEMAGGGQFVCLENSGVLIVIWSKQRTDQKGRAEDVLLGLSDDYTRSLFRLKRQLLRTFAGHMLLDPEDAHPILIEHMQPVRAEAPSFPNSDRMIRLARLPVGFSTPFHWDLTDYEDEP